MLTISRRYAAIMRDGRIIRFSEKIGQQLCGFRLGALARNNKARTKRARFNRYA